MEGRPWSLVCVCVEGEHKEQGPQNRFKLAVASAAEVDAAHAAAAAHKDEYGIRSFRLQDLNKVWWEIANLTQKHYDDAFARGDVRQ